MLLAGIEEYSYASRSAGSEQGRALSVVALSELLPTMFDRHPTMAAASGLLNNSGMPQPFSGGLPIAAAASSSAGVSAPSSGGGNGFDGAAILALLAVIVFGGKSLLAAREFLRPDSIPSLVLEHPG
jgi:hypothetical protein